MACNGWNHPPSCNCNFSGGNKPAFYSPPSNSYTDEKVQSFCRKEYFSFTIPNARCPACHQSVFFYSDLNGGKVFFDHLGPPWPKHSCTDISSRKLVPITESERKRMNPITPFKKSGWYVLTIPTPKRISRLLSSICLWHDGKYRTFFIPYHVAKIIPSDPIFGLDDEGGNTISLSFIYKGRPRYRKAFKFSIPADLEEKKILEWLKAKKENIANK